MQRSVVVLIELEVEQLLAVSRATAVISSVEEGHARRRDAEERVTVVGYQVRINNGSDDQSAIVQAGLETHTASFDYDRTSYDVVFGSVDPVMFEGTGVMMSDPPNHASASASEGAESEGDATVDALLAALLAVVLIAGAAYVMYRKYYAEKDYNLGSAEVNVYGVSQSTEAGTGTSYVQKKKRSKHTGTGGALSGDLFTIARKPENMPKNRTTNRLPYDATLVPGSYVNASLVKGIGARKYIATQGPMENTAADFWRMVAEQQCNTIAMLGDCFEDGTEQCHQYWPQAVGKTIEFADSGGATVSVTARSVDTGSGFNQATLDVKLGDRSITVKHFQFETWSDKKLPDDPSALIKFRDAVTRSAGDLPITVHCNNGAGRTGTYVILDMAIEQLKATADDIDISDALFQARNFRPFMVESPAQYIFAHNVFVEYLLQQSSTPAAGLSREHADFVKRFQVPPRLYPFDLGRGGRKILAIDKCTMLPAGRLSSSNIAVGSEPTTAKIVRCNDVVVVVSEDPSGALTLQAVADRVHVKAANVSGQPSQLKVKVGKELKLKFESDDAKNQWKSSLENMDGYVRTAELSGKRLMSLKPNSRKDALRIMKIVDPLTQEGADSLRNEFEQIPTIIQPSKDYATNVNAANAGRALGGEGDMANPLYGQVLSPASPGSVLNSGLSMLPNMNPMGVLTGGLSGAPQMDMLSPGVDSYSVGPTNDGTQADDVAERLLELEEELAVADALRMRQAEAEQELGGGYMDVAPGEGGYANIAGAREVGGYMTVTPNPSVPGATMMEKSYMDILRAGKKPTAVQIAEMTKNVKLANRTSADQMQKQLMAVYKKQNNSSLLDTRGQTKKLMASALSPKKPVGPSAMDLLREHASQPTSPVRAAAASPATRSPAKPQQLSPQRSPAKPQSRGTKKAWAPPTQPASGGFALTKAATRRMSTQP